MSYVALTPLAEMHIKNDKYLFREQELHSYCQVKIQNKWTTKIQDIGTAVRYTL